MYCKKCGAQNNEGFAFCPKCGEKLDTAIVGDSVNSAQTVTQQPVQATVNPESIPVSTPVVQSSSIDNKSNSGKGVLIGVLVGLLVLIIAIVVLILTGVIDLSKFSKPSSPTPANNGNNTPSTPAETKKTYKLGDAVSTVDGSKWHVIGVKGDNVTLLLDELVVEETGYGKTASEEDQKYANSLVKKYIDETYMPDLSTKIDAAGGDSSKIVGRILSMDDYLAITKSKFDDNYYTTSHTVEAYDNVEEVCKMIDILALTKSFWTSSNVRDYNTTGSYFGVIYIKRGDSKHDYLCDKTMPEIYAIVDTATDSSYQMGATFLGIRPVIETPTSNIK